MSGHDALAGLFAVIVIGLLQLLQFGLLAYTVSWSVVDMLAHGFTLWNGVFAITGVALLLHTIFHRK